MFCSKTKLFLISIIILNFCQRIESNKCKLFSDDCIDDDFDDFLKKRANNVERDCIQTKEEIELTKNVIINQKSCNENEVSIFIHSAAASVGKYFNKRQAIRKTWIRDTKEYNISVYFVIALPGNETTQKLLETEAQTYGDILQFGFIDDYYNLTLKAISILRWISINCLDSNFILKLDDDVVVNVKRLVEKIKYFKNGITGKILYKVNADRVVNHKWFMSPKVYPNDVYPDFALGAAYVMSKNSVKALNNTFNNYSDPVLDIDDLFMTGLLAEKAGLQRHDSNEIKIVDNCQIDVCVMSDVIVLLECKTGNESIDFWNDWKRNPDSCNNYGIIIIGFIIIVFSIAFVFATFCVYNKVVKKRSKPNVPEVDSQPK